MNKIFKPAILNSGVHLYLSCLCHAGGHLVIATWCQRDLKPGTTFSTAEQEQLDFLYKEWAHPFFVSKEEYARILQV